MNRDIVVMTIVSAIIGLCSGMSGILFTLYLNHLNISLPTMGIMFSISGITAFFVAIFIGIQCDVWRRKVVYSVSLLLNAISAFFTPFLKGSWELTMLRISDDIGVRSRASIHPTIIFEHARTGYAKIIAKIQGAELTFSGIGFLTCGFLLPLLNFQGSFIFLSLILFAILALFQIVREPVRPKTKRKSIWEAYQFDVNRQLKVLCIFNLLYQLGFFICHSVFVYSLFFVKKFAVDPQTLSILSIYNFTFGLPVLVVSKIYERKNLNYKKMFIIGNIFTGLPQILTALIPSLIPATAVWFLHDVIGASISSPAQQTLTQIYSRDAQRAKDVNMTSMFGAIGMMVGPLIGGFLANADISLPFIVGGAIITTATICLAPLK